MFPGLKRKGLTGAAMFYDGQMYSTTRLALSFLKSAVRACFIVPRRLTGDYALAVQGRVKDSDRVIINLGTTAVKLQHLLKAFRFGPVNKVFHVT